MELVFISDTHGKHNNLVVPDGDVLIHCGDFSGLGKERELRKFNTWMGSLPHEHKLAIAGNHELTLDSSSRHHFESLFTNFTYVRDESINIKGYNFYLSPWQPEFYNWAFNYSKDRAEAIWDNIPEDTDILVTHGPPLGILDMNEEGENCGCEYLLDRVEKVKPKIHAFGHIHEGYGKYNPDGYDTEFINASCLNRQYELVNDPIKITL